MLNDDRYLNNVAVIEQEGCYDFVSLKSYFKKILFNGEEEHDIIIGIHAVWPDLYPRES